MRCLYCEHGCELAANSHGVCGMYYAEGGDPGALSPQVVLLYGFTHGIDPFLPRVSGKQGADGGNLRLQLPLQLLLQRLHRP